MDKFKNIDVFVNNTAYGLLGYFKERSEDSIRYQIETNGFGTMKIKCANLPIVCAKTIIWSCFFNIRY